MVRPHFISHSMLVIMFNVIFSYAVMLTFFCNPVLLWSARSVSAFSMDVRGTTNSVLVSQTWYVFYLVDNYVFVKLSNCGDNQVQLLTDGEQWKVCNFCIKGEFSSVASLLLFLSTVSQILYNVASAIYGFVIWIVIFGCDKT